MEDMNQRNKNILLGILIVGVISMTIAFAALTTRLSINGTANVAATRWNIHFQGWTLDTSNTGTTGNTNTAVYPAVNQLTMQDNSNVTKVTGINVTLKQPGDYAKYTFQIINEGTIDAKLDNFQTNITNNSSGVIGYTVNCYSTSAKTGDPISENYVLTANNGTVYCDLIIEYNDRSNSHTSGSNQIYEQSRIEAEASAEWIWVQDDGVTAQTGGNSGGNEPTPALTWNNYITPTQESGSTLPSESMVWVQQTKIYDEEYGYDIDYSESCGVFPTGTVCLTNDLSGRKSDFTDVTTTTQNITTTAGLQATGIKGYAKDKAEEMLAKGATCSVTTKYVNCMSPSIGCYVNNNGYVGCATPDGLHGCSIDGDGYAQC